MSLKFIFDIYDFHNEKIVNNIFSFIFEGGFMFFSRAVYIWFVRLGVSSYVCNNWAYKVRNDENNFQEDFESITFQ